MRGDAVKRAMIFSVLLPCLVLAADAPSVELLEFLGDWETNDGEWQDPLDFMQDLEVMTAEAEGIDTEDVQDGR